MPWKRKITRKIADFIRLRHQQGFTHREIRCLLEKQYKLRVTLTSVVRYYKPWNKAIDNYRSRYQALQSRFRVERRKKRYNVLYHRLIRHIDDYILETFGDVQELTIEELSNKLAHVAQKDTKIARIIHLKCDTLKKKLEEFRYLPRAPPVYEIRPGVYTLKK